MTHGEGQFFGCLKRDAMEAFERGEWKQGGYRRCFNGGMWQFGSIMARFEAREPSSTTMVVEAMTMIVDSGDDVHIKYACRGVT